MFNRFRRILAIVIIVVECLCVSQVVAAQQQSFKIQTSIGEKTLVVPDGMTIEEAYCEMAKLYIEERASYETLAIQTEDLVSKAKEFEETSRKLVSAKQELADKEAQLADLYKKLGKTPMFSPVVLVGMNTASFDRIDAFSISAGVEIYGSAVVLAEATWPWSFGIKAGVKF